MDPSGFRTTFEVAGSEGLIEFDSRESASLRTHKPEGSRLQHPLLPSDDPYYKELSAFLTAVKDGTEPPVPGYEGLMALNLSLSALESAATGKVVRPARL
jgi:predicted dehydrogenase